MRTLFLKDMNCYTGQYFIIRRFIWQTIFHEDIILYTCIKELPSLKVLNFKKDLLLRNHQYLVMDQLIQTLGKMYSQELIDRFNVSLLPQIKQHDYHTCICLILNFHALKCKLLSNILNHKVWKSDGTNKFIRNIVLYCSL